jgi:hypothetical protein
MIQCVFAQDAKAAAVHIKDDRHLAGLGERPINVQPMLRQPRVAVRQIAEHLHVVTLGPGVGMQHACAGDASEKVVHHQRAGAAPQALGQRH